MARSFTMAPEAPRSSAVKPPPAKHSVGKSPSAAPTRGGHASTPHSAHLAHPAHRGGFGGWITLLVVGLAVAGGCLWLWRGGSPAVDPGTELLAQMEAAAQGNVAPTHAFGGSLSVSQANGRTNVVAEGVPSRACVQVGWRLARTGTIIVNGTLPTRLSAARLSELCSGDAATLMWVPDQ